MFKKNFPAPRFARSVQAFRTWQFPIWLLLMALAVGCRTLPPFPRVDLSEPAWKVQQGQAVWRARRGAPEIAGEILMATNRNGAAFIQFTKTPLPLMIAQTSSNGWQIEAPTQNKRYSGRGQPPARVSWFQLPRACAGLSPAKNWVWNNSNNGWELKNSSTGESLAGYFNQ